MLSKNFLGIGFIICFAIKGLISSYYDFLPPPPPPSPYNNKKQQQSDDGTKRGSRRQYSSSSVQTITTTSLNDMMSNDNYGFSVTITDPPRPQMNPGNLTGVTLSNKLKKAMYENTHMRDILLIHVGQSVGQSLFYNDNLAATSTTPTSPKFALEENRLANQTRLTIDQNNLPSSHLKMKRATSFLFPLRSPPDRVHDVYRYTHPANCQKTTTSTTTNEQQDNYGCWAIDPTKGNLLADQNSYYSKLWKDCFPSPNMELFAQELLPPYPTTNPRFIAKGFSPEQQQECRKLARTIVLGYTPPPSDKNKNKNNQKKSAAVDKEEQQKWIAASPEMYYNYQFYQKQTFQKYGPTKEIFVVRYEPQYEYNDMVLLDAAMGGYGKFHNPPSTKNETNNNNNPASKQYIPSSTSTTTSTLSQEATSKLCCILADEIASYWHIWDLSLNHNSQQRIIMSDMMRKQCNIQSVSWSTWMRSCREQIELLHNNHHSHRH